ncbi:MAG: M55 family metallopeptidase [Candidatus Pacebacteria bacterium]|nr:M55 family metallopeptidase [Candidatus Paceibacterota bacterium]
MKIYIVTDLEGATGVFKWKQTREKETPEFRDAMRLLMGDIAAVAEGLKQGGATEVLVLDGHNGGNNFIPDCMVPGVRYITGLPRPGPLCGLDESFDGIVLVGYHARNGTPDGVLHHTQSSLAEKKYWYDDVERGEIYQCAVAAGHYDVPVILVTGDEAACREARELLGEELSTVAVKKGISREAAVLLAAEETRPMLIEGAQRAMNELGGRKPLKPHFPVKLRIRSIGPNAAEPDTPWYSDRECIVRNGLDVISGSDE